MARRMVDDTYARIVVLGFVVWPTVKFAAVDFRPYALATLLVIASTDALVHWLDEDRWLMGLLYVALIVVTVYIHYLFGLVFVAHVVYAVARLRDRSTEVQIRAVALAAAGIALLTAPLVYQVAALWDRRQEWSIGIPVTIGWLASVIVPPAFVCAAAIAAVVLVARRGQIRRVGFRQHDRILVLSWAIVPIGVLVAVSLATSASLIQERYVLVAAPAIILLLALAIRSLEPPSARRIVVVGLAIASVIGLANAHQAGDWRGALVLAQDRTTPSTIAVVQPGFTESAQTAWLHDPQRRSFLLAPMSFYRGTSPVVLLPALLPAQLDEARAQVQQAASTADRVIIVTNEQATATWLHEALGVGDWSLEQLATDDSPYVFELDRVTT
jgi:uncharacterized membrane protein